METNAPVLGATVSILGEGKAEVSAKEIEPGIYTADLPWLDDPGPKPLVFTVAAGGEMDLLNGVLLVPGSPDAGERESSTRFSDPVAWLLVAAGVIGGMLVSALLRKRNVLAVLLLAGALTAIAATPPVNAHEGHDHAEPRPQSPVRFASPQRLPDGSVFFPKPAQRLLEIRTRAVRREDAPKTLQAIGTVIADPSGSGRVQAPMDGSVELGDAGLAYVGQTVRKGEVLARLVPTIPLADLGTMQQLRADVAGKLKIAEQKLSRLTRISSVVAQSDIEDTRAEIEALREQRRVLDAKDAPTLELRSPVSGVIATSNVRAGQVVSARDTLFEIVDPDRLWVEAAGADIHGEDDITGGVAYDADGHTLSLAYLGRSPALKQQSQALFFKLTEQHTGLAVGASVTVVAQRRPVDSGIILPRDAVVRGSNGLTQVWVKTGPESFKAVMVTPRQVDGARVLVSTGLVEGDRVVTRGSELINQVR
jgi:multidrug efflux pump subunit AcrA (membrane-fusion protein)